MRHVIYLVILSSILATEPPHSKPYFSSPLVPDLKLPLGDPLNLACKVHGYPPPTVIWYKDGLALENETPYEIACIRGTATLHIPETIAEDGGVYSCQASNPLGQDSTTSNVSVAGVFSSRHQVTY